MGGLVELLTGISEDKVTQDFIKGNEGFNPDVYLDTKNIATTGYGFNTEEPHVRKFLPQEVLDKQRGLTPEEGEFAFTNIYSQAVKDAEQFIGSETFSKLGADQRTVLIDMSYNLGLPRLSTFEKMKEAILSGDFEEASKELLDSKYAREDVPNRAKRNAELLIGTKEKK